MNLVLANIDYERHTSDEGLQLQAGLEHAGWTLAGSGYGDGCKDVPELLERHRPRMVLVHDKRDWDTASKIAFRDDIAFTGLSALRDREQIFRAVVVKDAAGWQDYHRRFCEETGADAVVVYYHPSSVVRVAPWIEPYALIRTWHSVGAQLLDSIPFGSGRAGVLVSGARGRCYPVREVAFRAAGRLGWQTLAHPGYSNAGTHTPEYLRRLFAFRVHVATASSYGFALRKIIESVACGCTPVTDLPEYDRLPAIDGALVRMRPGASEEELVSAVRQAEREWHPAERLEWARRARDWYDWREMGTRLAAAIEEASACRA